jgi:hypothetical protein
MAKSGTMRFPDFIGIGPARTGTTWLNRVLKAHIGMPRSIKEVNFFGRYYSKGLPWYAKHFDRFGPEVRTGEISPDYFTDARVPSRIATNIPLCKIVCILREPVSRLYSLYRLWCHSGEIKDIGFNLWLTESRVKNLDWGCYTSDLRRWFDTFGPKQVLVCLYDDLEHDPQLFLDSITDFIETPRIPIGNSPLASEHVHSIHHTSRRPRLMRLMWQLHRVLDHERGYRSRKLLLRLGIWQLGVQEGKPFSPLDPEVLAHWRSHFLADIEALEKLIGRDLAAWKEAPGAISNLAPARETA